jgi:hypothetical protein
MGPASYQKLSAACSLLSWGYPANPGNARVKRHLGELKALSQRNISVEERAERIQRDLEQNATDLETREPRNTAHAEMKSYGVGGWYIALVVGRFGDFSRDFAKLRAARLHWPSESLRVQ